MKNIITRIGIMFIMTALVFACTDDDSIPRNPVIKITGSTLDFGSIDITESSQVRSYTIAAEDLSAPITIEVEEPFYLSLNASGDFSNSISIEAGDFGNEALPVFVKFEPASSDEGLYQKTITHTSEDREKIASIAVSGIATIPGEPMLVSDKTSIVFGNVIINEQSPVQSYSLSGTDLEANLTLNTSGPFRISMSENGTFSNTLTFSAADVMDDTTVYVRFEPTEEGEASGQISHSSDDFNEPIEVVLTGTGDPIPDVALTTNPGTLDFGSIPLNQSSPILSYTLSGMGLTSDVTVTAPANYLISRTENGTFTSTLVIPASDFSGDVQVFVRFHSNGNTGDKSDEIIHTTSDLENVDSLILNAVSISAETKLFTEDFDYPAGNAIPATNRTGDGSQNEALDGWIKVRPSNSDILVENEGLSYSGYSGSNVGNAVKLKMDDPGSNSNVYAYNLSMQQTGDFAGAYYTSFMLRVDALPDEANGGFNRSIMLTDWLPNGTAKFLSSVQVNYNGGNPKLGVMYEGAFTLTDITPEIGKTYLVVLKHIVTDTDQGNNNNAAEIYVFQDGNIPTSEPGSPNARVEIADTGDNYLVKAVTLVRDNSRGGSYLVDGVRVSTQWGDLFE